jgi:hypothetical protein
MKSFKTYVIEADHIDEADPIKEGFLRALGMGAAAAAAGEITARSSIGGAALPPGVGAGIAAAWYIASGEARKDYNHGKKPKQAKAKWPVAAFKPRFA